MQQFILSLLIWSVPSAALADEAFREVQMPVNTGVSGIWILANICYAGMRAQSHPSRGWRIAAFIFGLPGTIVTYFVVPEGAERAYGIDLPRKGTWGSTSK